MTGQAPDTTTPLTTGDPAGQCRTGVPAFNAADYRDALDDFDLSEEQEEELLQTLWNVMSVFVDIGWGADSVQLVFGDLLKQEALDEGAAIAYHEDTGIEKDTGGGDGRKNA